MKNIKVDLWCVSVTGGSKYHFTSRDEALKLTQKLNVKSVDFTFGPLEIFAFETIEDYEIEIVAHRSRRLRAAIEKLTWSEREALGV